MRYLSVCSGIEAASVAWHPLGWKPVGFAEIEPFPSAVLAHRFPSVPNYGDMTKYKEWGIEPGTIDLLVGGTPCQSFSVAGLRRGLEDPRGNLMLVYGAIADHFKPTWIVWENVPGVLSSNRGRDFGTFLRMLGELGYGFAYRVLDAQYFGVAQRRRRVFVVGYLGDWRRAASVLFESEGLRGDPPPSREAREGTARVAGTLSANGGGTNRIAGNCNELEFCIDIPEIAACLTRGGCQRNDSESETFVSHTLRGNGFDASEDGTGRGTPLVPVVLNARQDPDASVDLAPPMSRKDTGHAVAVDFRHSRITGDMAHTIQAKKTGGYSLNYQPGVMHYSAVRRLTPRECERLQGFPDDWTQIPWKGRPAEDCPDGPRYKACGNSMAVPVMRWIGTRIENEGGAM